MRRLAALLMFPLSCADTARSSAPPLPPPNLSPAPVACRLVGATNYDPVLLRLDPSGGPFARVHPSLSTVAEFPTGNRRPGVRVRVADHGVELEGIVTDLSVYTVRPFLVEGVIVPFRITPLAWESAERGNLTISVPLGRLLRASRPTLHATRPCADFQLEYVNDAGFPRDLLPMSAFGMASFKTDSISVSEAPGASPFGVLPVENALSSAQVIERRDGHVRLAIWTELGLLVAWVPDAAVVIDENATGSPDPWPPRWGSLVRHRARRIVRCDHDIPLIAEVEEKRSTVGHSRKGSALHILEEHRGLASIELGDTSVDVEPQARLLVRTADITNCR